MRYTLNKICVYEMMPIRYTFMRHMPVRCTPVRCTPVRYTLVCVVHACICKIHDRISDFENFKIFSF